MMRKCMRVLAIIAISGLLLSVYAINTRAKYVSRAESTVQLSVVKPHYTVAFNANGGTGTMDNQDFIYDTAQALNANSFTRSDYHFVAWNTEADGSGDSYDNGEEVLNLSETGTGIITLYAQWEENEMHTVFEINGECVFHGYDIQQGTGEGYITGNGCEVGGVNYADGTHKFIDTGVKLYSESNYEKDYEVGFTILAYDPNHQYKEPGDNASQASFMNTKLEDESKHFPGLVVRRNNNKIEITQTINNVRPAPGQNLASATTKVTVARVDGVVYYAFNDDPFTRLQDINGTSDYFDTTVWFGSSVRADGITPMRYIDAELTNMYVKIGERGTNKHIISFDAGGVTNNPADVTVIGSRKAGSALPALNTQGDHFFGGWFTEPNGGGVEVTPDTVIESDMTLYAFWRDSDYVCNVVGGSGYNTLQGCIDAAGASDIITLISDVNEHITINSGKVITIDLGGYTLGDNNVGAAVVKNKGDLRLINGTITSSVNFSVIDNDPGAKLSVGQDLRIIATGTKQAIYNDAAELHITDNAYLSSASTIRPALENHSNGGKIYVEGGTIISTYQQGIYNKAGTLTIGVGDGTINANSPVIQGATYGITTGNNNISMYDGILRGKTGAIDNSGRIIATESGATAVGINPVVTEIIDGVTYKVLYYE